jgi:2-oxoglutarate dehydrogenase E1 component
VAPAVLKQVNDQLVRLPAGFTPNAKLYKSLQERHERFHAGQPVEWGLAELLAMGSLLLEGTPVRLTGQDTRRGTFSHRHGVLVDSQTGQPYVPLDHLDPKQAAFRVYDSPLSEAAALGFEFGYSLEDPNLLVLWEAQFGDFVNGGQVIIDQYITCSQSKWQRDSGLVLLLPHGYEGQGPEHSSARLERFLQACGEDNIQVCQPTTPAQYFHLLRRQVKRNFRKPLIVLTPKSLLRHKEVQSPQDDLVHGRFHEVLDDGEPGARRVLLCSGKVYYDLKAQRKGGDIALVRVEQFYPFPEGPIRAVLARYESAEEWFWVQEESQNMGGWSFMEPRMRALGREVGYIGRDASASPATGSHHVHRREQRELLEAALRGSGSHLVRSGGEGRVSQAPART